MATPSLDFLGHLELCRRLISGDKDNLQILTFLLHHVVESGWNRPTMVLFPDVQKQLQ